MAAPERRFRGKRRQIQLERRVRSERGLQHVKPSSGNAGRLLNRSGRNSGEKGWQRLQGHQHANIHQVIFFCSLPLKAA